ncbi:MAG: DEAD/DEAH box helicase [Candidatus Aenigmarchaeota archaeon]|nr:DEAD/DEAH box helicase [Candidatus Aenigmarchaeota archaeon]
MSFKNLDDRIKKLIKEKGFLDPSPAQELAINPILKNENVLLISSTGMGKTESAFFPILNKLITEPNKPISFLYITPLKSLNRDLEERMVWWCNKLGLEIGVRHGDTSKLERKAQVERPPNILVTTPESLGALLVGKKMRENLKNIKYVAIDEIHEIVGSKRGIQLSILLERLQQLCNQREDSIITEPSGKKSKKDDSAREPEESRKKFQRIGLSATIGSPELAAEFLKGSGNPVKIIRAEGNKKYEVTVENPKPSKEDVVLAENLLIGPRTYSRVKRIEELINKHHSLLVFTNTRETAEVLSSRLRIIDKALKQGVHHGSLSKEKRILHEKQFKTQELKSLIATSSLELGIDIGSIDMVIQYLSPRQVTRLIQRIGRAGHKVGEISKGKIISGEEDLFEAAAVAHGLMNRKLEKIKIHDQALDVLANQVIGLIFDEYEITEDRLYKIISSAYPYRSLTKEQFSNLLNFLEATYMIWINKDSVSNIIRKRKKAFTYYFENLTMIPDTQKYKVISIIQNEPVGSLDEAFVAEHGKSGEKFIFSGRAWRIIQVDGRKVIAEPIDDVESAIPAWEGELIPVPFEISQEVGKIRKLILNGLKKGDSNLAKEISEKYYTDKNTAEEMIETIEKHASKHTIPTNDIILIENQKDFVVIHSCNGSLVNDSIGRYLAALLTAKSGVSVNVKIDPYRIILQTIETPEYIKKLLESEENIEEVLRLALERSQLFKHRFLHVARRFGVLSKSAELEKISIAKIIDYYSNTPVYNETLREILLEKMDIEKSKEILEKIRNSEIKLIIEPGISHLGDLGLTRQYGDLLKPNMPEAEIFRAFRKRLVNTVVRLLCANCGEYTDIKPVKNVDEKPECPKCGSGFISCLRRNQVNASTIVKKKLKKKTLTTEEMKEFQEIRRSSDMVMVYGKKACIALAAHGIGPETAARILSRLHVNKRKFLKDILEAEKNFAKTRIYWKG